MKPQLYIDEKGITVNINWVTVGIIDKVDHSIFYGCTGIDENGVYYSGTAEYCCGEFEGIEDIERVSYMHHNKKPYNARILLKSIRYWQSVVNGLEAPKRPLAYYKNKLSYYTKIDIQYLTELAK